MASTPADFVVGDLADGAARVSFPGCPEREANRRATALARALAESGRVGFEDAVVGACTLLLLFDPATTRAEELLGGLAADGQNAPEGRRLLRIPVAYGGPHARALAQLAHELATTVEQLTRRHAAAEYEVAFTGFAPGFAYMTGLPRELEAPRLPSPLPRMPAGTVAMAGPYTGIYPGGTPGGWRAIGIAAVSVFDAAREVPALFVPGDRVRFEVAPEVEPLPRSPLPPTSGEPVLRVAAAGAFACVTGPPRHGVSCWGAPPGGPMDRLAAARANLAVGNASSAAVLEANLTPPRLEVLRPIRLAWWGSGGAGRCGQTPLSAGVPHDAAPGEELTLPASGSTRAYVAVAGGLDAPLTAARLDRGDLVHAVDEAVAGTQSESARESPEPTPSALEVRVVSGPHIDVLGSAALSAFLASSWRISPQSDRRGLRLEGSPLPLAGRCEVPPEGAPLGAIQVPSDGMPIVFGPDRPVTGGYARIATVISADWPRLAQARPGETRVRFREVTIAEAVAARAGR